MNVVHNNGQWKIEGPGAERAVLAFARAAGDHLEYEIDIPQRMVGGPDPHCAFGGSEGVE